MLTKKPMKLYVGARDYKPAGYLTVDIDPQQNPDVVANIVSMPGIADAACGEIVASHVLEHLEWPDSFAAMAEFSRTLKLGGSLKVAIPDIDLLTAMMKEGDNPFQAAGLLFGVGGRTNSFEQHRFGFNANMMSQILHVLGFEVKAWWNSPMPDASNGWCFTAAGNKVAISLNLHAEKVSAPLLDANRLYQILLENPLSDFYSCAAELMSAGHGSAPEAVSVDTRLYQLIHFQLIEARQRIKYLESELVTKKR